MSEGVVMGIESQELVVSCINCGKPLCPGEVFFVPSRGMPVVERPVCESCLDGFNRGYR